MTWWYRNSCKKKVPKVFDIYLYVRIWCIEWHKCSSGRCKRKYVFLLFLLSMLKVSKWRKNSLNLHHFWNCENKKYTSQLPENYPFNFKIERHWMNLFVYYITTIGELIWNSYCASNHFTNFVFRTQNIWFLEEWFFITQFFSTFSIIIFILNISLSILHG